MIKETPSRKRQLLMAVVASIFALGFAAAQAALTDDEIARLGADLTPMGAEKAGNAEGTIPAWEGGITEIPAGFDLSTGYKDPFADDKVLFSVTAANLDQYEDKLSPGQVAMLRKYPDSYKMNVYPTRRSASYPDHVYADVKKFAAQVESVDDGEGLTNVGTSNVPFPIPTSGKEVMWNHTFRWKGGGSKRIYDGMPVQPNGKYYGVRWSEDWYAASLVEGAEEDMLFYILIAATEPATLAGTMFLVHDPINQAVDPRRAWIYNSGQRRVRRAPELGYDFSPDGTEGLRCADQYDGWVGAMDRYNWKLIGKQELYVPYNSYKIADKSLKYDDILKPGHIDQELVRYELHRVWVVEAELKDGARHIIGKRRWYVDEDTWTVLVQDMYDTRGDMWRIEETHLMNFYDVKVPWNVGMPQYHLDSGAYIHFYAQNEVTKPYEFGVTASIKTFQPSSLRRRGR